MSIYAQQKGLLKDKFVVLKNSVCEIEGVRIISPSTLKSIIKVFYDVDHSVTPEGNFVLYLTIKDEYKEYGFDPDFHAEIPGDLVDRLDIFDEEERESVQFSFALNNFSELEFIENMYLELVDVA